MSLLAAVSIYLVLVTVILYSAILTQQPSVKYSQEEIDKGSVEIDPHQALTMSSSCYESVGLTSKLDTYLFILSRRSLTYTAADLPQEVTKVLILVITVNDPASFLENCTLLIRCFSKILKFTKIFTMEVSVVILSEKWEDNS